MCGHTTLNKIRNEVIQEKVGVMPIDDNMGESRLRQLSHINRRDISASVRRYDRINISVCKSDREISKKNWI